jgi:membrane peptidoglycan carboxypeptidase
MDEYNDNVYDEVRTLVKATSGGGKSFNGHARREESNLAPHLSTRPENEALSIRPAAYNLTQRRTRLNHFLLMKRRQKRFQQNIKASARPLTLFFVFLIVLISLISSSMGGAYAYYQAQLPLINGMANHSLFQSTRIYDRKGRLLYELYDPRYGRRTYVNYNDISPLLISATVAAEDHTFWNNSGVDVQGTLRAALANLQNQTVVEGGSTITQQLIKNQLYVDQARTIQVKGQEAILAYGLTQQYPKWKIMEMYLNTVYYGDLNYGVEAAAQNYFNLQPKCTQTHCTQAVSQLDLAQASLLAGLPQSPSYYDPTTNKPVALARQKIVLQSMVGLGMITLKQAQQAQLETAKYKFKPFTHNMQAPHFVHYVIDQVLVPLLSGQNSSQDGAQILFDGGFNIYTTLDLSVEKHIEQLTYDHLYKVNCDNFLGCYGPLNTQNNVNNAAVVVMDPANGEILAMNGSANYNDKDPKVDGKYNAALALRQPGSSMKPFVYATAFEMGWYPAMILQDHKTIYPTKDVNGWYTPPNYDGHFHTGFPMTVRNAIANSFNIPAVDAIEYTGIPNVLNTAARFGLTEISNRSPSSLGPSLALGTAEVSLLHLTSGYATFANRGVRVPPTSILEITNNVGHPLYTYNAAHPKGVQAIREDVAFLMNSILADKASRYHEFGPRNPLELDRPAAAKTGTTNSFKDNWTVGYTPYLAVGVWAGNSDNSPMNNVIGITGAGPIWHDVMEYVSHYYNYPPDDFMKPADVHLGTVSAYTGLLPHPGEPGVTDWFIDGTMPTIQGPYTPPPSHRCKGDRCKPNPQCPLPLPFCGVPPNNNNNNNNNNAPLPVGIANVIRK